MLDCQEAKRADASRAQILGHFLTVRGAESKRPDNHFALNI